MRRTVLSAAGLVAAALLLLALPMGGGVAVADDPTSDNQTDPVKCSPPGFLLDTGTQCLDETWVTEDYTDALAYYQAGLQSAAQTNQYMNLMDNLLVDTEQMAFMRAETAVMDAYQNDSTKLVAISKANTSVKNYYHVHQMNLLDHWDLLITSIESWQSQAANDGYTMFRVDPILIEANYYDASVSRIDDISTTISGYGTTDLTTVNGSSYTASTIQLDVTVLWTRTDQNTQYEETGSITVGPFSGQTQTTVGSGSNNFTVAVETVTLNGIDSEPDKNYLYFEGWGNEFDRIANESADITSDSTTFVEGIWTDLESGTFDPSNILSRVNKMYNYVQDTAEGNGTFNEAVVALSAAGLDDIDVASTSYMNVSYQPYYAPNTTVTSDGLLMSRATPDGGWEYGVEYNQTNIPGAQMFVRASDGDQTTIVGNFTIHGAYDSNGDPISAVDITNPDQSTVEITNTTEYQNLISALSEDLQSYENKTTDSTGSGPSGGGGGLPWPLSALATFLASLGQLTAVVVVAAGIVVLVVVS